MAERGAGSDDIDLAAFSEHLRTCRCPRASGGRRNHHTVFGARLFRQHLVEIGVCRTAAMATQPAEPQLVADFKVWLWSRRTGGAARRRGSRSWRGASGCERDDVAGGRRILQQRAA
jgi:hypothetical protein